MIKFTKSFNQSPQIDQEQKQFLLNLTSTSESSSTMRSSNDIEKGTINNAASTYTKEAELATYNNVSDQQKVWRDSSYDFTNDGDKFDFITSNTTSPQQSPALSRIAESPNNYGILTPKDARVSFHDEVIEPQQVSYALAFFRH